MLTPLLGTGLGVVWPCAGLMLAVSLCDSHACCAPWSHSPPLPLSLSALLI